MYVGSCARCCSLVCPNLLSLLSLLSSTARLLDNDHHYAASQEHCTMAESNLSFLWERKQHLLKLVWREGGPLVVVCVGVWGGSITHCGRGMGGVCVCVCVCVCAHVHACVCVC